MRLRDSITTRLRELWRLPRVRRALSAGGIGVALLGIGWVCLHLALNSGPVRGWLLSELRERVEERLPQVELGEGLSVDWLFRVTLGPVRVIEGPRALVEIGRIRVRPGYWALAQGRLEPASIALKDVRVDLVDGGEGLRRWWTGLRRGKKPRQGPASEGKPLLLRVEDLRVLAPQRAAPRPPPPPARAGSRPAPAPPPVRVIEPLELGPFAGELRLVPSPDGRLIRGTLLLPGEGRVKAELALTQGVLDKAEATVEGITADTLPELQTQLPFQITRGAASAQLQLGRDPKGVWAVHLEGQVKELTVAGERLSTDPVGPFVLSAKADLELEPTHRKVVLSRFDLSLGPTGQLALHAQADAQLSGELPFHLKADLAPVEYGTMLEAIPAPLRPPEQVPRLQGPLSATAQLSGELRHPEGWDVQVNLGLSALKKSARTAKIFLAAPFPYQPENSARELWVGEPSPSFVPIADLPTWVSRAVTMSEDAGFFAHQGFDFQEMRDSVLSALEEKRVRGASTITQQLGKNLFLSRQRTLSRKVQEALTTVALEAALPKARLLEIYLNIIEWGPNLYGIGEAARYYFGKDARALTLKEAAFLATIIPNPVRYHTYFERGALTENWEKRVTDLLTRMRDEHIISDDALVEAIQTPLVFRTRTEEELRDGGTGAP